MPINIRPIANPRPDLSLASYWPQTMPSAPQVPEPEPPLSVPSSSVRRALYAERNLQRAMDPGALDFAVDGSSVIEEEEEAEEDHTTGCRQISASLVHICLTRSPCAAKGRRRYRYVCRHPSDPNLRC